VCRRGRWRRRRKGRVPLTSFMDGFLACLVARLELVQFSDEVLDFVLVLRILLLEVVSLFMVFGSIFFN